MHMTPLRRDRIEVLVFDGALILSGIVTLPLTHSAATHLGATGVLHALVQAILLFVIRATARYLWRRHFRRTEQ